MLISEQAMDAARNKNKDSIYSDTYLDGRLCNSFFLYKIVTVMTKYISYT